MPVLATPRLVALVEEATVRAVAASLQEQQTTVGMRVEMAHLQPVFVGETVRAEATLERVEGRRLSFNVSAHSDQGLVAAGKVTRVVVNRDKFLGRSG